MKYQIDDVKRVLKEQDFDVFVHGCNMRGAFSAGIAGIVADIYPKCEEIYQKALLDLSYKGGHVIPFEVKQYNYTNEEMIKELGNMGYQVNTGEANAKINSIDVWETAIKEGFTWSYELNKWNRDEDPNKVILNALTQDLPGKNGSYDFIDKVFNSIGHVYDSTITYPLIGCGIAGLEWNIVKEIIDFRLRNREHYCIVRPEDIIKYKLEVDTLSIMKYYYNK